MREGRTESSLLNTGEGVELEWLLRLLSCQLNAVLRDDLQLVNEIRLA